MDGHRQHSFEGSVAPEALVDDILVPPKDGVAVSQEIIPCDKEGAPCGRKRDWLWPLARVFAYCAIMAFIAGILIHKNLPLKSIQPGTSLRVPTLKDSQKPQLSSDPPPPPTSSPAKGEAAVGFNEVRHDTSPDLHTEPYDTWGLHSLSHFEQTLSPELKKGKEEIAYILQTSCPRKYEPSKIQKQLEQTVAVSMSLKMVDGLVGITIDLDDVEPIHPGAEEAMDLPRSVRVTRVLRVQHPVALMEVEDTTTGKPFAMRFRFIIADVVKHQDQEQPFLASVQRWADSEEAIARQASCGTPAHLVAVQRGLGVPMYAGGIANVPKAYFRNGFYFFGRVQIFEGLHGQFDFGRLITSGISVHAKEYIANRLLQIVFKLQQAQLSHNNLSWDSIDARPDGSFVLSGFDNCTPFGKPIGIHIAVSGKNLEPTLRIQDAQYTRGAMASANSDLWSLGMLLYELFTDGKLPYTEDERSYTDDKVSLAFSKYLIDQQVDPKELVPILDASNCPPRWKMLIVRLLHPLRCERITAWGILREFPDLVGHSLPR